MSDSSGPGTPGTFRTIRFCLIVITTILALGALEHLRNIAAPFVLAIFAGVILVPVTDRLERLGLKRSLSALLVLVVAMLTLATIIFFVEPLVWRVIDIMPRVRWEMKSLIRDFRAVIQGLDQFSSEVEQTLGSGAQQPGAGSALQVPSLTDTIFVAPIVLTQVLIFVGGFFFFLLGREELYQWIAGRCGGDEFCTAWLSRIRRAERMVSRYFLTVTAINAVLGAATAGAMMLLQVGYAPVWGAAAMLLNYIIYLGPTMLAAALLIAGLVMFEGLASFAPMVAYLVLNMIEAQFVTPALVGRHVQLNPLLVFVSLVFWLFLWGPMGAIVAIPILVAANSLLSEG